MLCPNCHTENRANAKFCDECGLELPTVAPVAREMFGSSDTSRLDDRTQDLQGLDQFTDSSYSPNDVYDELDDDPAITQAFVAPAYLQQKRTYYSDGTGVLASQAPAPASNTGAFPAQGGTQAQMRPPSKGKRIAKGVIIGLLCAIVAAAAIVGITYSMQLWGGHVVPDVLGMTTDEATDLLEGEGFVVEVVQVKSDEPEGIVLACSPDVGDRIDDGSTVTIDVSVARTIPNIVGKSLEEAERMLAEEGFTNVEVTEVKSNEAEGTVTSVSPQPGTRSKADAKITVEAAVPYRVPDVAGMSQEEATSAIEAEGYTVKVAYVYDEDVAEGSAVSTDPQAGSALDTGSQVMLNLAKHRSTELISLTRKWLDDSTHVRINGFSYEISEVGDITYSGNGTCAYTIVARKYETHSWFGQEPETRYGNPETIKGTITWNDSDEISGSDPKIERG